MTNPRELLACIAESQIGTEEDASHSNRGAAIRKYKAATELDPDDSFPWCAAFIDWCIKRALELHQESYALQLLDRPRTAAAFGLERWAAQKASHGLVFHAGDPRTPVERGDLVVYSFSHCGIVTREPDHAGIFVAVEGNTNSQGGRDGYQVAQRLRALGLVRSFIAIT